MAELTAQDVEQIARQAAEQVAQAAATQAASQVGQQLSEQISQSVSAAVSKVMQSQTQTTGATMVSGREELADIGGSERLEKDQMADSSFMFGATKAQSDLMFANMKRTYDEYQQESLETIRRNRSYIDKVLSDAAQFDNQRQTIANQALQNAVETANMVGKQALRHTENVTETENFSGKQANRHSDIAIDRQWNVDEQGYQVNAILESEVFKDSIQAAVSQAVNDAVARIAAANAPKA